MTQQQQQSPGGEAATEDPHREEALQAAQVEQEGGPQGQCGHSNVVRSNSDTQFSQSSGMKVKLVKPHEECQYDEASLTMSDI